MNTILFTTLLFLFLNTISYAQNRHDGTGGNKFNILFDSLTTFKVTGKYKIKAENEELFVTFENDSIKLLPEYKNRDARQFQLWQLEKYESNPNSNKHMYLIRNCGNTSMCLRHQIDRVPSRTVTMGYNICNFSCESFTKILNDFLWLLHKIPLKDKLYQFDGRNVCALIVGGIELFHLEKPQE